MLHLKDGLSLKSRLGLFSVLVFRHTVALFLLTHSCAGQSQLIGPPQPIVATVGDDIILPCHLEPAMDAAAMTVEWARPDLDPRFVHVWRDGVELLNQQNPSYRGRTSLSMDKLKLGDVSLNITKVKLSDGGRFRCFIPLLGKETFIELVVDDDSKSNPVVYITVGLAVLFLCVVAVFFVVWKWRRNKNKSKKDQDNERKQKEGENKAKSVDNHFELQSLREGEGNNEAMKDPDEKKSKLKEELQKKEGEWKHWEEECEKLMKQKSELGENREINKLELEKLKRERDENEKKLQSVRRKSHKDAPEKDKDMNVLSKAKSDLEKRTNYLEKLIQKEDKALEKKEGEFTAATERKKKAEEDKEQINMKLKEVEKQRDERERKIQADQQQNEKPLESLEENKKQGEKSTRRSQRASGRAAGEDQVTEGRGGSQRGKREE